MNEEKEKIYLNVTEKGYPAFRGSVTEHLKYLSEFRQGDAVGRIITEDRVTVRLTGENVDRFLSAFPEKTREQLFSGLIAVWRFDTVKNEPELVITGRKRQERSTKGEKIKLNVPHADILGEILTGNQLIKVTDFYNGMDVNSGKDILSDADWNNLAALPDVLHEKRQRPSEMSDSGRREIFLEPSKNGFKYQHHKMGEMLIEEYGHIIFFHDNFYKFDGKRYVGGPEFKAELKQQMQKWYPEITDRNVTETLSWIEREVPVYDRMLSYHEDPYTVNFANGRVNVLTGEIRPFSPYIYDFSFIPTEYHLDATSEKLDKFIRDLMPDEKMRAMFWEFCGTIFSRNVSHPYEKALLFYGPYGGNGKSTLFSMMQAALHDKTKDSAVSMLSSSEMVRTFSSQRLDQKMVNFSKDDHFAMSKEGAEIFKKAVDNEEYFVQEKHHPGFTMTPFATMFFASNEIPQSQDLSGGFTDRFIIIPLMKKFRSKPEENKNLKEELQTKEVAQAFIANSVKGLMQLTKNKDRFTEFDNINIAKTLILTNNSSVSSWIEECRIQEAHIVTSSCDHLYEEFKQWSEASGIKNPPTRPSFVEATVRHFEHSLDFNTRMIYGKRHFVYNSEKQADEIRKIIKGAFTLFCIDDIAIESEKISILYEKVRGFARNRLLFKQKDFVKIMEEMGWTVGGHGHEYFRKKEEEK